MSKDVFRVGDRVKCVQRGYRREGQLGEVIGTCSAHPDRPYRVRFEDGDSDIFSSTEIEYLVKTLATLQEGDIVLDGDDDQRTILGVIRPGLYVISKWDQDEQDRFGEVLTEKDMEGWTIKDATPEVVEMTVADAAKKMGIDPSKLRIKD
jgi:hypothetical protein